MSETKQIGNKPIEVNVGETLGFKDLPVKPNSFLIIESYPANILEAEFNLYKTNNLREGKFIAIDSVADRKISVPTNSITVMFNIQKDLNSVNLPKTFKISIVTIPT